MAGKAVYVVSTETFAGKTAVCAGLARWLEGTGRRVGYLKPLTVPLPGDAPQAGGDDSLLMRRLLRIDRPLRELAPVWLDDELATQVLREGGCHPELLDRVMTAWERQADRDVVLVEGAHDWRQGEVVGLPARVVAERLAAAVLVVARCDGLMTADRILAARAVLGARVIGAIINGVGERDEALVETVLAPSLEARGLPVFGIMASDRSLRAVSVNDLVHRLCGRLVVGQEAGDNLVEHLVIGAMNAEAALAYFRQQANKAVVTGGDRTDVQLAALETPTTCLVLTGNLYPSRAVIERARALAVPIVLVEQDTAAAVRAIERLFDEVPFRQTRKIERLMPLLEGQVNLPRLLVAAGLT